MKQQVELPIATESDRTLILFGALLLLYLTFQVFCTINVLGYFPDGFGTENFYHPIALNLLQFGEYALGEYPDLRPSTFRPPLYSLVLAGLYGLFGPSEVVGIVFNNLLLAALMIMVFLLGRRIHGVVGLIAVVLLMLDPVGLAQSNRNQSDLLFAALITLSLLLAWNVLLRPLKYRWVALAALALSLATFTRAAGMYLWIPLVISLVWAHWRKESVTRLVAAVVLVAAIHAAFTLPWMMRNNAIVGSFDFAGMKGWHLVSFLAPLVIAKRDGIEPQQAKQKIWDDIRADPRRPADDDVGAQQDYLSALGSKLVFENWPHLLLVLPDNVPKLFLSYPSEPLAVFLTQDNFKAWHELDRVRHLTSYGVDTWGIQRRIDQVRYYLEHGLLGILGYGLFLKMLNALVLVLGFVGLVLMWRAKSPNVRHYAIFLFLTIGCLTVISVLVTQGRFRLPLMPGFTLCAGYALLSLYHWIRQRGNAHSVIQQSAA